MGHRTGLVVLTSAQLKPSHPAAPHPWWTAGWTAPAAVLVCGLIGVCILVWGVRRRPAGQQADHTLRDRLGWALILAFCVGLSLLARHAQVTSGLTLVVTVLACVVPPAWAIWINKKDQSRAAGQEDNAALIKALLAEIAQANRRTAPTAPDAGQAVPAGNVTVLKLAGQSAEAAVGPATLADARQVVQDLRAQVDALRGRVLAAVLEYGPDKDWRLLLGGFRSQLKSCTAPLDQLYETRNQWAEFGETSFAVTDTLVAARRAAASLGDAIDERYAGGPAQTDLAAAVRRLDHVVGQLAGLLDGAVPDP